MRRYLIVDDNQAFADNLAEILRDTGADVDVASSGGVALEMVASTRYDALVSDMRMPVMGGAELVHRIRRMDPGLPAIVVTAYTHDDDLLAARSEGLLAIFPKPLPMERLIETLSRARRDGLVALVEDDVELSDNLCEALRDRGFAAVTAASVLETERLGVRPFAGLVDLRVPGGPDGAAMARLAEKFSGLPLLVMTAHLDRLPSAPHDALFRKPFSTVEVLDAVERVWARRNG